MGFRGALLTLLPPAMGVQTPKERVGFFAPGPQSGNFLGVKVFAAVSPGRPMGLQALPDP